jgi:hypothetical protein
VSANDERGVLPPGELVVPMPPVSPPRPAGIPWVPIADMPEDWKDGREVLVHDQESDAMHVVFWLARHDHVGWETWGGDWIDSVTHVAAINPPESL